MADVFGRMATVADMEAKLSAGKSDSATLWETEEQALRYVLEDGKLNLCLRILTSFKKAQVEARKDGTGPMVSKLYDAALLTHSCSRIILFIAAQVHRRVRQV